MNYLFQQSGACTATWDHTKLVILGNPYSGLDLIFILLDM